jgi:putative hemolysin
MNFMVQMEQFSQLKRLSCRNPDCTEPIKGVKVSPQCKFQEEKMSAKSFSTFLVSIGMIILSACNLISGNDNKNSSNANMPNPASVFCEDNGGKLDIRTAEDGSQSGVCVFPDGSECDEWAFFRGECKPGGSLNTNANMANPAAVFCEENGGVSEIRTDEDGSQSGVCVFPDGSECDEWAYFRGECNPGNITSDNSSTNQDFVIDKAEDGWNLIHNEKMGYSLQFPADARITENDDPSHSFTIQGPIVDDEYWPVIFIAHPSDAEDYLLPEGYDLEEWLSTHNLIDAENYEVTQIAGTPAVHTRFVSKSGQSYNFDHYFFAHNNQLYSIVILHTAGKEDWEVYNRILESFKFDL